MEHHTHWNRWKALAEQYTKNLVDIQNYWSEIKRVYSAPKRTYHNLAHLENMIFWWQQCCQLLQDADMVLFAIYYHDFIYNIHRKDNELLSANLAAERLTVLGVPAAKIERCRKHILATATHGNNEDLDSNYLVDMDLAILGVYPDMYKIYCQQVRKEYAIYPDFLYRRGRKKVIAHFLSMPQLYKTLFFQKKLEAQARINLEQELRSMI